MPVPLPAPADSKQTPPDAAEARVIAGGVAGAVAPGGELTSLQRMLIEAVTDAMTGFVVPGRNVPRLDPEEFARALADRDLFFRTRMVHFMLVCALVLNPLPEEVVERVEAYARELIPGRPGSAPPLLAQHDWMHVLAHYGSTVEAELEVFAFISRANDDPRAFSLLAMVISLFETGYLASGAGLFEYDRGHLSHEGMAVRLGDALRRGALVGAHAGGPDLLRLDWFERAHMPIDVVREELGIVRKSEAALDAGSVGPWEAGGISPFQHDCGKRKAAAEGREYDSFGATPS